MRVALPAWLPGDGQTRPGGPAYEHGGEPGANLSGAALLHSTISGSERLDGRAIPVVPVALAGYL